MLTIHQILTKYWGYSVFRPMQEDIINSVMSGKDTLALLPTGGGKSICFQVPALAREGVCLVVSPLIALMKDQVENLKKRDIPATAVISGMDKREIDIALGNCIHGKTKFLYLSPERLASEMVVARISQMNVNFIAVDEAHCISQWGYDFRPPYLKIAEIRKALPGVPVLALTATATSEVVKDIQERLQFPAENVFQKSFERKNLSYVVIKEENKLARLRKIIDKVKGSGIVYVRNRRKTREIAEYLRKINITAEYYHAGLSPEERSSRQELWVKNRSQVMVATNAFGMGIDKPDVRFVVHLDLPDSLEAYFQEAGRGGRDEKKSYAILLYNDSDILELEKRVKESFPDPADIKNLYQALANFFQLPVGSGKGLSFDFDMNDFCSRYNIKPVNIFNSLGFLERDGYISATETLYQPSRIHILLNNEELYQFQVANQHYDNFIKFILRSYSGVFNDYVRINEEELASRMKISKDQVVESLQILDKMQVLSYLPRNNMPKIFYIEERLEVKNLRLSKEHYDERKKIAFERRDSVIHYITSRKCRSQALLAYFGETDSYRCGVCDICLERNKLELSNLEFENVSGQVKNLLQKQPLMINEIVHGVHNSREDKTLKVIQWLIDNEKIINNEEGKLEWRSGSRK